MNRNMKQGMGAGNAARRTLLRGVLASCTFALARPYESFALGVTYTTPLEAAFQTLLSAPGVASTLGRFGTDAPQLFEAHKRLAAMPAAGRLAARRDFMLGALREAGLAQARIDEAGNVIAVFPGGTRQPRLLLAARLDAPDQGRGLLVLLAVLHALQARPMQAVGDIVFAGLGEGAGERGLVHALGEAGQADGLLLVEGSAAAIGALRPAAAASGVPAPQAGEVPLPAVARRAAQLLGAPTPLDSHHPAVTHAQALGVPAAVLGDGRLEESVPSHRQAYRQGDEWKGPQTLFLATLALCGLAGVSEPLLPARQSGATPPRQ